MRQLTDAAKVEAFMTALGRKASGPGRVYFTGGASAVLVGWRNSTAHIDLKLEPEPAAVDARAFRAKVEAFVGAQR